MFIFAVFYDYCDLGFSFFLSGFESEGLCSSIFNSILDKLIFIFYDKG